VTKHVNKDNVDKKALETIKLQHRLFKSKTEYSKQRFHKVDHDEPNKRTGKFPDISPQSYAEHAKKLSQFLKKAKSIDTSQLPDEEKINNRIFQFQLKSSIENIKFDDYLFPMSGDTGFYFSILTMGDYTQISNAKDAQFYLEELQDLPNYFDQWIENMQLGIKKRKSITSNYLS